MRANDLLAGVADRNGLRVQLRVPEIGVIAVDPGEGGVEALRERLAGDPLVERVTPERVASYRYLPSDFAFNVTDINAPNSDFMQWNLRRVGAIDAWDLSKGVGAEVAVVDSGADGGHPDLASHIVGFADHDPSVLGLPANVDEIGHGTHVAGLACADSDSAGGYGIASLGFDCNLYVIKTRLSYADISASIVDAANHGADAINLSLGACGPSGDLRDAIDYAWARGSVPVTAAKNIPDPDCPGDTDHGYPARYVQPLGTAQDIDQGKGLVVTAAEYSGARADFGGYGTGVSVAAFASAFGNGSGGLQGVVSTWPGPPALLDAEVFPSPRTSLQGDNRFAYLEGTSMATPQVSGLVALMRAAKPGLSAAKLVRLVKLTGGGCSGFSNSLGWGVIDARGAVGAALGKDVTGPASRVKRVKRLRGAGNTVRLRLKRSDGACDKELPRSGVKSVTVFASSNGGRYHRVKKTSRRTLRFRGKPGRRYRFYSRAVDKAGNREPAPARADARVKLAR
jgi:subtilisin family serine protease